MVPRYLPSCIFTWGSSLSHLLHKTIFLALNCCVLLGTPPTPLTILVCGIRMGTYRLKTYLRRQLFPHHQKKTNFNAWRCDVFASAAVESREIQASPPGSTLCCTCSLICYITSLNTVCTEKVAPHYLRCRQGKVKRSRCDGIKKFDAVIWPCSPHYCTCSLIAYITSLYTWTQFVLRRWPHIVKAVGMERWKDLCVIELIINCRY